MVVEEEPCREGAVLVPVELAAGDPEPPGSAGWMRVDYHELSPFEGAVQVVKVFVPWSGFARARALGFPLSEACLPRPEFVVN